MDIIDITPKNVDDVTTTSVASAECNSISFQQRFGNDFIALQEEAEGILASSSMIKHNLATATVTMKHIVEIETVANISAHTGITYCQATKITTHEVATELHSVEPSKHVEGE